MLRKLLLILIVGISSSLSAQVNTTYFSWGYHPTWINTEDLGFIIDRYNETRQDCNFYCLRKDMPQIKFAQDPTFALGVVINGSGLEMS